MKTIAAGAALLLVLIPAIPAEAATTPYEAENATLSQAAVATNHTGYTGTGFVDYTNVTGSYVQFSVTAATAGNATLDLRFANGTTTNRPMDISVNGTVRSAGLAFAGTGSWDTWQTKTVTVPVTAGTNTIRAAATTAAGGPNLDSVSVTDPGGGTGGPNVPFGSHLFPYAPGTLKPTGSQAALDQATLTYYNAWKAAFVKHNCGNGWTEIISPDADHPYVAEAQGYGMVITALMAGADPVPRRTSTAWSSSSSPTSRSTTPT